MDYSKILVKYALPKDAKTNSLCDRMFDASHVLIGGTTGCGKSTLINSYIYSVVGRFYPFEKSRNGAQFVLIDPKRVALNKFKRLPHTVAYACENKEIIALLQSVIGEMDRRYRDMAQNGLEEYNKGYLIVIVDELGDLMTTCKKQVMPLLQRIAQLGRASRIKLVCATQCPNRKIIPAELTVNFTGCVAMRCKSAIESVQIIGRKGAELLPQYGKVIYLHSDGNYYDETVTKISDDDMSNRIRWWAKQTPEWWRPLENKTTPPPTTFWGKLKAKVTADPRDYKSFWAFITR